MDIQQVLRWIVVAIVLIAAVMLLGAILQIAGFVLKYAIRILLLLLIVAIVLRFVDYVKARR